MTLDINWGSMAAMQQQPADPGAAFWKSYDQSRDRLAERLTGNAINALMKDPANATAAIGDVAKVAPQNALALIQLQQKQQDRQRDQTFREAQARYVGTFGQGGGAINALMQPDMTLRGQPNAFAAPPGVVGADGGPPISAAPPPPADWKARLGEAGLASLPNNGVPSNNGPITPVASNMDATGDAAAMTAPQIGTAAAAPAALAGPAPAFGSPQPVAAQPATDLPAMGGQPPAQAQPVGGETPMPAAIAKAAQSPNMEVRNRAFAEMVKIDPIGAMKIDSEMRDAMLDRLEDADKAYRLAIARLPRVTDETGYQQVLSEVEALLQPLGASIRNTVPANYPGPEGVRELLMKATDAQQQLAAMDRRFSAEARAADIEADNQRADRNTDSMIADRSQRTGIQRQRAETAAEREARMAAGGGRRGGKPRKSGGGSRPSAVNPATGERIEYRGGKWVPAK